MRPPKNVKKTLVLASVILIILMNMIAGFHAYKFTHFAKTGIKKTVNPAKLSLGEKIEALIIGVDIARPANSFLPSQPYETIKLQSNKEIECWSIKSKKSKGTVILFHGFIGQKSTMIDKSDAFLGLGYNTLLVDFMGSGGSEGNQTTIGFFEANQVKTCVDYLISKGEKNIILFGTSMGAVAVMKAVADFKVKPKAIILECPFGSMYQTVCARFKIMGVPTFPMAGLLVLWGGLENGFWAFGHNPSEYAKSIDCPTLLMYGARDERVSRGETDEIFANLNTRKQLKIYQRAGHENYLTKYEAEWTRDIREFLK